MGPRAERHGLAEVVAAGVRLEFALVVARRRGATFAELGAASGVHPETVRRWFASRAGDEAHGAGAGGGAVSSDGPDKVEAERITGARLRPHIVPDGPAAVTSTS